MNQLIEDYYDKGYEDQIEAWAAKKRIIAMVHQPGFQHGVVLQSEGDVIIRDLSCYPTQTAGTGELRQDEEGVYFKLLNLWETGGCPEKINIDFDPILRLKEK